MGWKVLPYWLKGGILGLCFSILFFLILFINMGLSADSGFSKSNLWVGAIILIILKIYTIFMLPLHLIDIIYFNMFDTGINSGVFQFLGSPLLPAIRGSIEPVLPTFPFLPLGEFNIFIIVPIYFILIGLIIGWIVGKIKSKK
jgi:hypothetical protein